MRFKEYLIHEKTLTEELIQGGIAKMLKRIEFWFDGNQLTVDEKIHHLEQEMINAGGSQKFAMVVRRIPAIKHFILKHTKELTGDLEHVAHLLN